MTERLREAARRLASPALQVGFEPIALHRYTNLRGKPHYWRIRLKHPDFESLPLETQNKFGGSDKWIRPIKLDGNNFVLGEPKFPNGKPLYALRRITDNPDAVVWIVEGEQKADALKKLGLVAGTSGGSTTADGVDWKPLTGRTVMIWPDNDDPGKTYAGSVANILLGMGCAVSCVDVDKLGLGDGEDVMQWFEAHPGATAHDIETLPALRSHSPNEEPQANTTDLLPRLIRASDVESRPIDWIWNEWIAGGKLHVIGGAPGLAKTTIALSWAATVTNAGRWADGSRCDESGDVVIWSGEDSIADTLRPRLEAMKADLNRIHFVGGMPDPDGRERAFDPATDVRSLLQVVSTLPNVKMLIVDPIVSAVAGDSHKNAEVRRGLQPLVDFAEKIGAAVIGITHFSKGTSGREPLERLTGSLAFGALARLVFGVAKLKDDDKNEYRALVRIKSNIGPDGGGFRYDVEYADIGNRIIGSSILWGHAIEGTARELLATAETTPNDESGESVASVSDWLRDLINDEGGRLDRREVMKAADAMGHKERTVHRARDKIGLIVEQHGFGKDKRSIWMWPSSANNPPIVPIVPDNLSGTHGRNESNESVAEQNADCDYEEF